ncbi:MAG: hypothetical protein NkDv07_0282 [Candidatus Improbicoccus devescovinae]|nr:MAG: hypothetical protein NkDv07_0282 [Candidatus Improbicoccus devescovinae]
MRNTKIYQKILVILFLVCIFICQGAIQIAASAPSSNPSGIDVRVSREMLVRCGLRLKQTANAVIEEPPPNGYPFFDPFHPVREVPMIFCHPGAYRLVVSHSFFG